MILGRYILRGPGPRRRAAEAVLNAPENSRVEIKEAKRSLDQNAMMWTLLTDVADQKEHCGRKYTKDQWKLLFLHACGQEMQFIPTLDGNGFMPMGYRSSELSKAQMSELIECILAWGAQNGVVFSDERERVA